MQETDGLRAWAGGGAVRLADAMVAVESSALLLEAAGPGTAVSQVLPPSSRTPCCRPESAFLQPRAAGKLDQITRVRALNDRVAIIPLFTAEPAGEQRLAGLTRPSRR
jgi:hypothetical protein